MTAFITIGRQEIVRGEPVFLLEFVQVFGVLLSVEFSLFDLLSHSLVFFFVLLFSDLVLLFDVDQLLRKFGFVCDLIDLQVWPFLRWGGFGCRLLWLLPEGKHLLFLRLNYAIFVPILCKRQHLYHSFDARVFILVRITHEDQVFRLQDFHEGLEFSRTRVRAIRELEVLEMLEVVLLLPAGQNQVHSFLVFLALVPILWAVSHLAEVDERRVRLNLFAARLRLVESGDLCTLLTEGDEVLFGNPDHFESVPSVLLDRNLSVEVSGEVHKQLFLPKSIAVEVKLEVFVF